MKHFSIVIAIVLAININFNLEAANTVYYVDAVDGSDSNSGISDSTAWQSLLKVDSTTFSEGDTILFKAGCSWEGQLYPKGSGSSTHPIVIDMYGSGDKPIITTNGTQLSALYFINQAYWEINNLEITNVASEPGDYRGIHVEGRDFGTIDHFYIKNCYVHDVTGEVNWIGGSSEDSDYIHFGTGWDASKRTGGIVFEISSTAATPVKTKFNDILVENCVISDCSFGGFIIKQLDGEVGWGVRNSASDANWYPHTNVMVRGNYFSQYNTDLGCNTIYLCDVQGAVVENNLCAGAGTCAIETYYADDVIIQNNETHHTVKKAGGADFNGIDPDKATTNIIVQKNYVHDNGDGILFCQFGFGGDCIVRYNILQNNSRYSFNLHSSSGASANIYNNVIYSKTFGANLVNSSGGSDYLNSRGNYILRNNIFYSPNIAKIESGDRTTFNNNCYYGISTVPSDDNGITDDPLFVDPGTGGSGVTEPINSTLDGYKLTENSPCINAGTSISDNGGEDYFGNLLYNGCPDIGVHEYSDVVYPDCPADSANSTKYEAEEMILSSYAIEANAVASGGYCIKASGTGTAMTIFNGSHGTYDLKLWYFDETDGEASYVIYLNDETLAEWIADQDFGTFDPDSQSLTTYTISDVSLSAGDTITIQGTAENYDYARVDLLECINPVGISEEAEDMVLSDYVLNQNYPNPFNPSTKISYSIPKPDLVILKIYNSLGQYIQTLVNKYQRAGEYTVNFNVQNLSSGIYFYKLQVGNSFKETKKMLLMQ